MPDKNFKHTFNEAKKCSRCKSFRVLTDFSKRKKSRDGLNSWCKLCFSEHRKASRIVNRKHVIKRERAYYSKNRQRVLKTNKKYMNKMIREEKVMPSKKICRVCKVNKSSLSFYKTNYTKSGLYTECKECRFGIESAYRKNNMDRVRVWSRNRIYKEKGAVGTFSYNDWLFLLKKYESCLSCGTKERLEADHVVPLSKGGDNSLGNLQVLCRSCNSSKGIKVIDYRI